MDKDVYLTAGRSIFLDGGITFYRLDLATGDVLVQKQIGHMSPEGENYHALVDNLSMPPGNNDVLSSNGKNIFMSSQILTMDGDRIMTPAGARNDAAEHSHIFSPTGMLDDSWWHRGYFAYGDGVSGGAGWTSTFKTVTGGKLLCADDENVYSFGRQSKYNRWTLPLEFCLASTSKNQKKSPSDRSTTIEAEAKSGTPKGNGKKGRNAPSRARDMSNPFHVNWSTAIPIWVKAMFVTDNTLVVAGPSDLYDEEKAVAGFRMNDQRFTLQQEHMEGKHGAVLKTFDESTGRELSSVTIQSMPVFDGMILAGGRVFMSTVDGTVLCFAVE
jgi:hypothetical protein